MNTALKHPSLPSTDDYLNPNDVEAIREIVRHSGVFTDIEIATAGELAEAVLSGTDTSYRFLFVRAPNNSPIAYTCYGEIPLTDKRYDLYWIVVDPAHQSKGLARQLMQETETKIRQKGGMYLYAETSGTPAYAPARAFYLKHGFAEAARFPNFYRDGDDKVVFCKSLAESIAPVLAKSA